MKHLSLSILFALSLASPMVHASDTTDAVVTSYDGMIHLELSGKPAERYFKAIHAPITNNGAAQIKELNEEIYCAHLIANDQYRCTLSHPNQGL